jgi:hypothetical protein
MLFNYLFLSATPLKAHCQYLLLGGSSTVPLVIYVTNPSHYLFIETLRITLVKPSILKLGHYKWLAALGSNKIW